MCSAVVHFHFSELWTISVTYKCNTFFIINFDNELPVLTSESFRLCKI